MSYTSASPFTKEFDYQISLTIIVERKLDKA